MGDASDLSRVLHQVPLFSSLPQEELRRLVKGSNTRQVQPGDVVIREGFHKDGFYILLEGQAEVVKALGTSEERQLAVSRTGALLGEMSLFTEGGAHTASVRALTALTLMEMTKHELDDLLMRHPTLAHALIAMMTERLSESENQVIVDLRAKNEQLGRAYQELKTAQSQLIHQERLQRELELARAIQASLLPTRAPSLPGFEFAAYMTPASAVGGDFYDYIPTPDDRLGIGIGDVSDHGVPSALMMAQAMTLLRVEARRGVQPDLALGAINREFMAHDHMGMFLTALYGELDPATGCFAFARAGHNPPLVMDPKGRVDEAPHGPGQPLGLLDEPVMDLGQVNLAPGCVMLLYTDGVTETANESGDLYGLDRMQAVLARLGPAASPEEVCQGLHADLREFRGRAEQGDDVTSVAIKAVLDL